MRLAVFAISKVFFFTIAAKRVVCSQGLPVILQIEQEWSLDRCVAVQNRQALVEHLSATWSNFWQLVHCIVGETFRYLTTLAATPTIRIFLQQVYLAP